MASIVNWMMIISVATDNAMNSNILANSIMRSIRKSEVPRADDGIRPMTGLAAP